MIMLAEAATAIVLPTRAEDSFLLQPDDLAAAITSKTRMIILCNPSCVLGLCCHGTRAGDLKLFSWTCLRLCAEIRLALCTHLTTWKLSQPCCGSTRTC